jgi:maltokinase
VTPPGLAAWVASADGSLVLPERHAAEAATISWPLALLDTVDLAPAGLLAMIQDAAGRHSAVPLVDHRGGWRRARAGDGAASALTSLILRAEPIGSPGRGFEAIRWAHDVTLGDAPVERAIDVDQTNESVVVGDRVVVKWTVRPSAGPEPAPERLAALAAAGFPDMPRPWGLLRWRRAPGDPAPVLVATVVAYLPGARDGWDWAVEDVRALARGDMSMADAVAPWLAVGDLVARMHLALPEQRPADTADAQRWQHSALAELEAAIAAVSGPEGSRLREHSPRLREMINGLAAAGGTQRQDVHGDLHVGQLLRWQAPSAAGPSYAVTDFDGNPVLTPEERFAPAPAAVDVAGLVQSLDHVGRVVSHRTEQVAGDVVDEWTGAAQAALLETYRAALETAGRAYVFDPSLLPALRARQLIREFLYAARHLPHWRYVPHAALPALVANAQTPGRPVRRPTDQV